MSGSEISDGEGMEVADKTSPVKDPSPRCRKCQKFISPSERHGTCILHRDCSRQDPCHLDCNWTEAQWEELETRIREKKEKAAQEKAQREKQKRGSPHPGRSASPVPGTTQLPQLIVSETAPEFPASVQLLVERLVKETVKKLVSDAADGKAMSPGPAHAPSPRPSRASSAATSSVSSPAGSRAESRAASPSPPRSRSRSREVRDSDDRDSDREGSQDRRNTGRDGSRERSRSHRGSRGGSRESRGRRASRDGSRESRDRRTGHDRRESRDRRDSRDRRGSRERREHRERHDSRERRGSRERRDRRGSRERQEGRGHRESRGRSREARRVSRETDHHRGEDRHPVRYRSSGHQADEDRHPEHRDRGRSPRHREPSRSHDRTPDTGRYRARRHEDREGRRRRHRSHEPSRERRRTRSPEAYGAGHSRRDRDEAYEAGRDWQDPSLRSRSRGHRDHRGRSGHRSPEVRRHHDDRDRDRDRAYRDRDNDRVPGRRDDSRGRDRIRPPRAFDHEDPRSRSPLRPDDRYGDRPRDSERYHRDYNREWRDDDDRGEEEPAPDNYRLPAARSPSPDQPSGSRPGNRSTWDSLLGPREQSPPTSPPRRKHLEDLRDPSSPAFKPSYSRRPPGPSRAEELPADRAKRNLLADFETRSEDKRTLDSATRSKLENLGEPYDLDPPSNRSGSSDPNAVERELTFLAPAVAAPFFGAVLWQRDLDLTFPEEARLQDDKLGYAGNRTNRRPQQPRPLIPLVPYFAEFCDKLVDRNQPGPQRLDWVRKTFQAPKEHEEKFLTPPRVPAEAWSHMLTDEGTWTRPEKTAPSGVEGGSGTAKTQKRRKVQPWNQARDKELSGLESLARDGMRLANASLLTFAHLMNGMLDESVDFSAEARLRTLYTLKDLQYCTGEHFCRLSSQLAHLRKLNAMAALNLADEQPFQDAKLGPDLFGGNFKDLHAADTALKKKRVEDEKLSKAQQRSTGPAKKSGQSFRKDGDKGGGQSGKSASQSRPRDDGNRGETSKKGKKGGGGGGRQGGGGDRGGGGGGHRGGRGGRRGGGGGGGGGGNRGRANRRQ